MKISDWRKRYIDRLIENGAWRSLAEKSFEMGQHDYQDSPEDAAEKELSYWIN